MTAEPSSEMPPHPLPAGPFHLRAIGLDDDWRLEQELSQDADVVRWTFYPDSMDESAARARVRQHQSRAAQRLAQRYVILDQDDRWLGTCGLGNLQGEAPEVFYALLSRGRGRGAATAATKALTDWALANGHRQVALVTIDGNGPSDGVARRAGFLPVQHVEGEHRGQPAEMTRWFRSVD